MTSSKKPSSRLLRRLLLAAVVLLAVWVLFFDSHSVIKRLRWHREYTELSAENEHLRQEIDVLEDRLDDPLSDEVVEQIAREEYGMRRPGETVYPVEE